MTSAVQIVNGIIDQTASDTNTTWSLSDTIAPAAGGTLNLSLLSKAGGGNSDDGTAGYNTTNVTTLNIRSVDQYALASTPSFDLTGLSGLTKVSVANSSVVGTTNADTLTLSSIKSTTAVDINTNGQFQNVTLTGADWTGAADTLNLSVTGRSGAVTQGTGVETLAITTTDAAARLGALASQTTATNKTVTVAGEGLKIDAVLDSTITSFDASKSTGPVNVFLAPGTTLTSAKGGTGTADVLAVNALGTTQTISGFEKIQAQTSVTYNLSTVTGATTLGVDATVGGTIAATFENAAATTNTISVSGGAQRTTAANATNNLATGAINYKLATATGLTDAVTLALDNGGITSSSTTVGTLTLGGVTTNGNELVTIATTDWKAVTLGGLSLSTVSATAAATVKATGSANLNVGTLTNSASSTSNSTVDFSGVTGTVTMNYDGGDGMTYTGSTGVDTIILVTTGVAAGETQTYNLGAGNDVFTFFNAAAATSILVVNGEAGDDTFNAAAFATSTSASTKLDGGDGTADKLLFTAGVNMTGVADIANVELIEAQLTGSIVRGGAISGDTIAVTNFGATTNRLQVTAAAAGETVNLSNITFTGPNLGLIVNGSVAADAITGTSKTDTITTGGGADTVIGGGAADTITGAGGVDTVKWNATTAALFATETGSTAGTSVDHTVNTIGDTVATWTSGADKLHFAAAAVTNAAGTEIDTLVSIAKAGGVVTNVARFVHITDTAVGDATQTGNGAITILNGLNTSAVAIGDSFIAAMDNDTNIYLYYVKQVSAADTIAAQDVTLIGAINGITTVANGDFVSF